MAPEGRVVALGRLVVEDDEVADILIEVAHAAIIFVAFERADRLVGKEGEQALDAVLDEVDARRFERFQKARRQTERSEEHTSELQSLMRISYAVFCLKKKKKHTQHTS